MRKAFLRFLPLLLLSIIVQPVAAHAVPVESKPRPNQILEVAPGVVLIEFNEPVVPDLSQIHLLTQAGERVQATAVYPIDATNRTLQIDLPPLADGAYLVSWQVLSSVDGHTTSGSFSFGVGDTVLTAVSNDVSISAQLSPLNSVARALFLVGSALIMGFFAFRLLVWNPILGDVELDPEEERLDIDTARFGVRVAHFGIFLLFAALLIILIDQNQAYRLTQANNLTIWLGTQFGVVWLVRLFVVAFLHFNLTTFINLEDDRQALRGWEWWSGFILALGLTFSNALVSHSAALAENTFQAVLIDWSHVIAATIWAGGLVYFAFSLWQGRFLSAGARSWLTLSLVLHFSGLAAIAVGVLIPSGSYLAWRHMGSWTQLVGTVYGQTLIYKLVLSFLIALIAWVNLMVIKPRMNRAYEASDKAESARLNGRFNAIVRLEAVLAILILLLAGVLTDLQRGVDAPLLRDAAGQTTISTRAEDLTFDVEIEPALVGQNEFVLEIVNELGQPIPEDGAVQIRFTFLGQSVGAATAEAVRLDDGRYYLEGSYISLVGEWQMEISVRRPGRIDTFAPIRLEAGLGGTIRPLDQGFRPLEEFAKLMTLLSTGGTGAAMVLFALLWGFIATRAARTEWQLIPMLGVSLVAFWFGTVHIINFFEVEYTPAKFATNPILPDANSIAIGQSLYTENCVPCHGLEGRADGPAALNLNPRPADFTDGHTATHTDGDLFYWILQGVEGSAMPAFEERITREEAWHLVNYVRRLSSQGAALGFDNSIQD